MIAKGTIPAVVARLHSVTFSGIEAVQIEVEVDVAARGFCGAIVLGIKSAHKVLDNSIPSNQLIERADRMRPSRAV